jgi:hypothetical protein
VELSLSNRRIGLVLLVVGGLIYIFSGLALERRAPNRMADFRALFYGARCFIQHEDPYREDSFLRVYEADGWRFSGNEKQTESLRKAVAICINLPTALFLVIPFALAPWGIAQALWSILTTASFLLAAFLMWTIASRFAPALSGLLIGFILSTSQVLFAGGNAAGIVVSFCVIALWCFLEQRYQAVGMACLAIGLLAKPHDAGMVWLYFLLAGAAYRKHAVKTLAVAILLGLPALLWASVVAPSWLSEMRSNLFAVSMPGEINDPGPGSIMDRSPAMIIDLQADLSILSDRPQFYNLASYLLSGALLLVWSIFILRTKPSTKEAWLAIASIAALTMLPTYHHPYDARLLLASVPGCALLWMEGRAIGVTALLVTAAALTANADIPITILKMLTQGLRSNTLFGKLEQIVFARPTPWILLLMAVFYLYAYIRHVTSAEHLPDSYSLETSQSLTAPRAPAGR